MIKKATYTLSLATGAALLLGACAAPEGGDLTEQADGVEKPASNEITAQSPGKPSAAITLTHKLRNAVGPGQTGVVDVTVADGYDAGAASLTASGGEGVEVIVASALLEYDMSGDDPQSWEILFQADSPGARYINITANVTNAGGGDMVKTFSLRVDIEGDNGVEKADGAAPVIDSENNEVILEAEETIDN